MNHDGSLDLREYLMGNGVERQAAKAVMDSWRAQRKAVKSQIASERARQKAEREQAKAERELERERARNDRLERQQYGGGGGMFGNNNGYNNGYNNNGNNGGTTIINNNNGGGGGEGGGGGVGGGEGGGGGGGGGEVDEYGEVGGEEVDMYGAAPQDLPDGGPSFGGSAPKVLAGAFAKRKKESGYGKKVKKMNVKKLEAEILKAFKERFKRSLEFKQPQARVISLASLQSKKVRRGIRVLTCWW